MSPASNKTAHDFVTYKAKRSSYLKFHYKAHIKPSLIILNFHQINCGGSHLRQRQLTTLTTLTTPTKLIKKYVQPSQLTFKQTATPSENKIPLQQRNTFCFVCHSFLINIGHICRIIYHSCCRAQRVAA